MWHRLGLRRWLGRDDRDSPENQHDQSSPHSRAASVDSNPRARHDNLTRRLSRRVGVGLPRSTASKRQNPERRDRLAPLEPDHRRAQSADRSPSSGQRSQSPLPPSGPRLSAPEVQWLGPTPTTTVDEPLDPFESRESLGTHPESVPQADWEANLPTESPEAEVPALTPAPAEIDMDLENRWILNLSMHFRDRSEREKFFITYVENPYQWRRVTISCDYRDAAPDSLEQDLKGLRYQRDKSARIYESIRESLPEIQFYDTVTNLKVETRDGRLHVHVTEDVNETIPYPPISSVGHLAGARCVPETLLQFDSHLSGFVYKVQHDGQDFIKKEIPGPDTVDEFLYEINALHALNGAPNVIQVGGIVVDEHHEKVKGLLISYAEKGALVDILYEQRGQISFARRERWAKQIVQGLCEIHESGYVQGDFTLSNIVVDADDNAHIIDINRRGCPVGWEPPEIAEKIESNQRISMYIGVKTDLYQLGMTLWALAMQEDEPERQPRPLFLGLDVDVPDYYRRIVDICLSPTPRHRMAAKELLSFFPLNLFSPQAPRLRNPAMHLLAKHQNVGHPPARAAPNSFAPLGSYKYPSPEGICPPLFHDHPDQGKRSTVTLADSNDAVAFPSRHSSASTLNQHESNGLDRCWDETPPSPTFDSKPDLPTEQQIQNAVPSVWANTVSPGFDPRATELEESRPQSFESRTDSDESGGYQRIPVSKEVPAVPTQLKASHDYLNSIAVDESVLNEPDPVCDEIAESVSEKSHVCIADSQNPKVTDSATSLFLSVLPINPALSKRKSFPPDLKSIQYPSVSSSQPEPAPLRLVSLLAESRLPINPAVVPAVTSSVVLPNQEPSTAGSKTPTSFNSSSAQIEAAPCGVNSLLSESQLPINPAVGPSEPRSSLRPLMGKLDPVTLPARREVLFDQSASFLSDSRLPINPAVGGSCNEPIPPVSADNQHSGISIPQSEPVHHWMVSLSESRLPINPSYRGRLSTPF